MLSSEPGSILTGLPAGQALVAQAAAPAGTHTDGVPTPGMVIAWVLVADPEAIGGARVDPVFLADGRAFTPDQYRAAYGQQLTVRVGRAQ